MVLIYCDCWLCVDVVFTGGSWDFWGFEMRDFVHKLSLFSGSIWEFFRVVSWVLALGGM